jgi:arylsulfatase A-like enzyme
MRRLAFVLLMLVACVRSRSTDGTQASSECATTTSLAASAASASPAPGPPKSAIAIDFEAADGTCTLSHRGVLLDLADRSMRARSSGSKLVAPDVEMVEHYGASWVSVRSRSLELSFVSSTEMQSAAGIVVEARVRGGLAKSASVYLNGKPIGALAFSKDEPKVVSARVPNATILRGTNELLLRFNGGPRNTHDALAEIDWIRVGPNDGDAPYSAPTRSDAFVTTTIGGIARRGVSLRAPGSARCTGFVPNGAVLEGFIGAVGGEGEAEVRVLVDRSEPRVVGSFQVGGPGALPVWRPVSLPLGDVGTIAGVELVAKAGAKGARIVFAQPRVVVPEAMNATLPAAPPRARGVVVVVLGTVSRKQISPYGGPIAMPELARLAEGGTVFDAHRGVSSFANGALASMLSGALAREHGVDAPDATLSPTVFTFAEAARQAGVVTAMFTANPTTTSSYGFARGFETFTPHMPGDEVAAVGVFDEVTRWLDGHKDDRFLLVVHARGGHPPWDVTSEEVKDLPPANYAGSLEPKRAGEGLAKAKRGGSRMLADADRERAFALHAKAVAAHDAALGKLAAHLRALGREKDTAWIVTSDVGVDAGAHVPFLEEDALDEGALALPLVVRLPGAELERRVATATSALDVTRTVLEALALRPPAQLRGAPLWTTASRGAHVSERPLLATTGTRFSARWAGFALVGVRDRELKLCNLLLDPDCVSDVRPTHPLAAEILHAMVFDELVTGKPPPPPTARVIPDAPTTAALKAWGR